MYKEVCAQLRNNIAQSNYKIKQSEENAVKKSTFEANIASNKHLVEMCDYTIQTLKPLMDDVNAYISDKREKSSKAINEVLAMSSNIIPDSMKGIMLKMDEKSAKFVVNNIDVDHLEGSGYKSAVSAFLQSVVLKTNPLLLQSLLLDEPFSTMDLNSSAVMSSYLPVMAQTMQIILVEQKKEAFENTECTVFNFFKDERGTVVRKDE